MCITECICLFANTQSIILIVNIGALMLHGVFMFCIIIPMDNIVIPYNQHRIHVVEVPRNILRGILY